MGSFSLSGVFTALPDPEDYQPDRIPEHGAFIGGKPVRQGFEAGSLRFPPLPSAAFNELRSRYETTKNTQASGTLPLISGYGWSRCSAYWHEPVPTGWDGPIAHGVTMAVSRIIRW